jgi:hypothetical protein
MSLQADANPIELHLFSPEESEGLVELLTAVAHYHLTGEYLDLGHTVNLGRPWLPGSACDRAYVSLPYLDGPRLEWMEAQSRKVRFLWLVPITERELQMIRENGVEALEKRFETTNFNVLDPRRSGVV